MKETNPRRRTTGKLRLPTPVTSYVTQTSTAVASSGQAMPQPAWETQVQWRAGIAKKTGSFATSW
ncbi:MAG: hypothetical protein ACAH88_03165, partial [Roseimicrobium sp.]